MILIISEEKDQSTNYVIDWLICYEQEIIRINETSNVRVKKISLSPISILLECDAMTIDFTKVKSLWYRRGWLNLSSHVVNRRIVKSTTIQRGLINHLITEIDSIEKFIYFFFETELETYIGNIQKRTINKLAALSFASKVGLNIPATNIITDMQALNELCNKSNQVTKSVKNNLSPYYGVPYYFLTNKVDQKKGLNEQFFPTKFQNLISKKYEIRSFYICKEIYSVAIFSQSDKGTMIDYRNYNYGKPNRFVPIVLPIEIEQKLHALMEVLQLNTGSIDLIYTKNNEYVFLEVNPVGQYGGMVSEPGNYYLDKIIAKHLCGHES
jgi:ATP-GRASP peptide maturase of grasp-with-spasm system